MTASEWATALDSAIPASLSCAWDHDGIQCMTLPGRQVSRVLCTLDVTAATVDRAVATGADLIIAHHPLLFRPVYSVTPDGTQGYCLTRLAETGIALCAYHTRADILPGGVADLLAQRLGLTGVTAVETPEGALLRIGVPHAPVTVAGFAAHVRAMLETDTVLLAAPDADAPVRLVAVVGGEGGDFLQSARAAGADVFVAGRIGYHRMLEAERLKPALIEAGHYATERGITSLFAALAHRIDGTVTVDTCTNAVIRAVH